LISFIIPVRNEKENIIDCINSIKNSISENYEIIVVDDNSNDGTYELLKKIENIKVIRVENKPENAIGKNYALYIGYLNSNGEILIFLDADVRITKEGLNSALNLIKNYDVVSFSPKQITKTFFEFSIQPIIFYFLEYHYPYSKSIALNGQFIAIKRSVYEDIGTHKALLSEVLEDVKMAKLLSEKGYKIYFNKTNEIYCRMYKNLREIIYGWSKNLYLLSDRSIIKIFKPILRILALLLFWYLIILLALFKGNFYLLFFAILFSNFEFFFIFKDFKFYNFVSATVGIILFFYIALNSIYWHKIKKEVYWKDRKIKLGG